MKHRPFTVSDQIPSRSVKDLELRETPPFLVADAAEDGDIRVVFRTHVFKPRPVSLMRDIGSFKSSLAITYNAS